MWPAVSGPEAGLGQDHVWRRGRQASKASEGWAVHARREMVGQGRGDTGLFEETGKVLVWGVVKG